MLEKNIPFIVLCDYFEPIVDKFYLLEDKIILNVGQKCIRKQKHFFLDVINIKETFF